MGEEAEGENEADGIIDELSKIKGKAKFLWAASILILGATIDNYWLLSREKNLKMWIINQT